MPQRDTQSASFIAVSVTGCDTPERDTQSAIFIAVSVTVSATERHTPERETHTPNQPALMQLSGCDTQRETHTQSASSNAVSIKGCDTQRDTPQSAFFLAVATGCDTAERDTVSHLSFS